VVAPERAAAIAAEIYEKVLNSDRKYAWTLEGLLLLEDTSERCRRLVQRALHGVPEQNIAPYRTAWREVVRTGQLIELYVEDIIVPDD
jgi:hypothetical protein